jgi:hypothetical protein
MTEWFYSRKGTRSGPHEAADMTKFAAEDLVDDDTLCWTTGYGTEWKPFSQTELHIALPSNPNEPPPLPPGQINNFYAYMFAVVPLIGSIVEVAVAQSRGLEETPTPSIFLLYGFAYLVLASLGMRAINRSGNEPVGKRPALPGSCLHPFIFGSAPPTLSSGGRSFGPGLPALCSVWPSNSQQFPMACS